jgi:hypothetical protein
MPKDGVREQRVRLCEQANGRRWCQEGTADIFGRKMIKKRFDREKSSKKVLEYINLRRNRDGVWSRLDYQFARNSIY